LNENTEPSKQPFTGFTHWLSPAYASDTNPKRWHQECVDLSTLPEPHGHPTLLFYIFGDQAITLSKDLAALPSEKAKEEHVVNASNNTSLYFLTMSQIQKTVHQFLIMRLTG